MSLADRLKKLEELVGRHGSAIHALEYKRPKYNEGHAITLDVHRDRMNDMEAWYKQQISDLEDSVQRLEIKLARVNTIDPDTLYDKLKELNDYFDSLEEQIVELREETLGK